MCRVSALPRSSRFLLLTSNRWSNRHGRVPQATFNGEVCVLRNNGHAVIGADLIIQGELRTKGDVDVLGYVTGSISAQRLTVQSGGKVYGTVRADSAEVNGVLQGTVAVRNLFHIGSGGAVTGDVHYGSLRLDTGGELSAKVKSVPPELAGDFHIAVKRGGSVTVTTEDIDAIDPDSGVDQLTFTVSNASCGYVARKGAETAPVEHFTEADLRAGQVVFVHDGSQAQRARFDVTVADESGGTSGAPKPVLVTVVG